MTRSSLQYSLVAHENDSVSDRKLSPSRAELAPAEQNVSAVPSYH